MTGEPTIPVPRGVEVTSDGVTELLSPDEMQKLRVEASTRPGVGLHEGERMPLPGRQDRWDRPWEHPSYQLFSNASASDRRPPPVRKKKSRRRI